MKFSKALQRELSHADEGNWRDRLDALHSEHGSWKAVADHLGADKRTVERWRNGYVDRRTHERRQVSDATIKKHALPKIGKSLGSSRKAQLAGAPDLKRMSVRGHISIGNGEYERDEDMDVGRYMSDEDFEAIGQAYIDGNDALVDAAMDKAMSDSYIGDGATKLTDVVKLWFLDGTRAGSSAP